MKIALFTIWHIGNYGAELQTYATCKVLKELGADVLLVDYRLDNYLGKSKIKRMTRRILDSLTFNNISFSLFWNKYFPKKVRYKTLKKLKEAPPTADVFMVGSDQVWNPTITKDSHEVYFLNFGNDNVKKVSYASSFGFSSWTQSNEVTSLAEQCLKKFDKLSCREKTGVKILDETFGLQAQNVLDPTLLLNNYKELIRDTSEDKDLVYYPLSPNNRIEDLCKKIGANVGLNVVNVNYRIDAGPYNVYRTPIVTWLSKIAHAKFVVTSSFHGLTMCIVHKREFVIVMEDKLIIERGSRVIDLLELLNLKNRLFFSCEDVINSKIWEQSIDYNEVHSILEQEREFSLNYLKEIINL